MAPRGQRQRGAGVGAVRPGPPPHRGRRVLPPGHLAGRAHGRVRLRLRLLALEGGRGARLRARPRDGALPHIVGRQAAHRVRQRRRASRPGRVGLPAVARVAVRARLHGDVVDGPGARRPLRLQGRGQPRVAPRGQRQPGAGVGAVILIYAKGQQNRVRMHAVGLGRLPGPRARRRHRALPRPLRGLRPRRDRSLRGPRRAGRLGLAAMGGAVELRPLLRAPLCVGARPRPRERQCRGGQPRLPVQAERDARPALDALLGAPQPPIQ